MAPQWAELDPELDAIFHDDEPEGPELPRKPVPTGDVYEAARAGDVERLSFWLDLGVNVNARDAWDSVALYYACLAGHLDAAHMLLESGAICSENTFDGDRCHYAALNLRVRKLLKAFEARPPPLAPLPRSLRELFLKSPANLTYLERSSLTDEEDADHPNIAIRKTRKPTSVSEESDEFGPDVTFSVAGRVMKAHRAILAARSPYFKRKFETDWKDRKQLRFVNSKLTYAALFSLLHYFYTDRLDVAVYDMEDLVRVCKVCECIVLKKALEKELAHQKFANYKSLRGVDDSQKRFILQGSSLSWQEQLPAAMRRLFRLCLANSRKECSVVTGFGSNGHEIPLAGRRGESSAPKANGHVTGLHECDEEDGSMAEDVKRERMAASSEASSTGQQEEAFEEDHADVIILVDGVKFRCHRFILAARSEYFNARFARMSENQKARSTTRNGGFGVLPVLEEHDLSAGAFEKLLEYIYTDYVEDIDPDEAEEMFDAASRYLLFPLKRAVVDVLLPHLESTPPAELCHWLLLSDMYGVSKLREHCLDAMALNFELFASTREFRQMLKALPPPSGDSEERTTAPSAPGELVEGRDNLGNILDDLREKWLAIEGEELDQRDQSAREFDQRLAELVEMATLEEAEMKCREDCNVRAREH
ncbi:ankyrin repeat and BTB/POZ domain-containing protein 1 [Marchantia polymorpha subsp. ruderalis]|uniref:BTB domain-containing protein n=2 Tax=Marchantia polymorpha TaxID=3197 RepID=A0A176VZY4_MARPO|nr:hypothetical protein AXG93_4324s1410 [Marchantia polymorpha subsp. ruderalis]PTQ42142.1 hypothetical protein MARPO_0031s0110 [Marchantia polymorpha]BBN01093.1 hypothetical protein Mp_2g04550 [Marchantia polymorpha subsp. ruderalis]|eukprot:PTQ42142.1 hypothetical protein MARPO_0031s0110 [Marchantia polymorpha]